MKRIWIALVCISCSNEIIVRTDFDRSVQIQRLTNYRWLYQQGIESRNNPIFINELSDKRVKEAVDRQMKEKGYLLSQEAPLMILHYHFVIENKSAIRTDDLGYNYSPYWTAQQADSFRYREGTFIIDFMDANDCNLIWRGWAVSILNNYESISEEVINEAVIKIFESFPISAAKEVTNP